MQGAAKDLPRKVHPHHDGVLEPEPKQHDAHQRCRGQRPAALGWGLGLRGSRGGGGVRGDGWLLATLPPCRVTIGMRAGLVWALIVTR